MQRSVDFTSSAEGQEAQSLDLNQLLVRRPAATFMLRLTSSSMTGAGVLRGDVLVIDRSLSPRNQDLVVVLLDGELVLRRLVQAGARRYLQTEDATKQPSDLSSEEQIWGVVTGVVRTMRS
jgi:DNA polymerase V